MFTSNTRKIAEEIFFHAVASVQPQHLLTKNIVLTKEIITLAGHQISRASIQNLYVVGAGKATAPMAQSVEQILKDQITDGLILVKHDHTLPLQYIQTVEAAHPVPDENGIRGTAQIVELLKKATPDDLVIVLISGGGSSLLIDVPEGCTLAELQIFFNLLLKSGADIGEMNTVRKHLSRVKGGQLAKIAYPAQVITLILSDVIGDPLDVIASGPTVPDPTTFTDAWQIVRKYNLEQEIPLSIRHYLQAGLAGTIADTPKAGDKIFTQTANYIIGSNTIALEAAKAKAETLGFHTAIVDTSVQGEAQQVAKDLVDSAKKIALDPVYPKPACLLMGGETTVKVTGEGLGGRNQELALAAALQLKGFPTITVLSGGTDGSDGPTDAAGAVVDEQTIIKAQDLSICPEDYLANNDSYHFFQQTGGHLITGPTLTNVMDIMMALIY